MLEHAGVYNTKEKKDDGAIKGVEKDTRSANKGERACMCKCNT